MPIEARIAERTVGGGRPCFIIAEAGVNHNGDVALAHKMVAAAAEAKVDAVKFQAFVSEDLASGEAEKAAYQSRATGAGGGQLEMLKALELSSEEHAEIMKDCQDRGLVYLCTPYETTSVDMLTKLGVVAFKIASTDTNNTPLLRYIAGKRLPVILSTGMSDLAEVEEGVEALRDGGCEDVMLLQCTAEYPAPPEAANLRVMDTLREAFQVPTGFSDHSAGVGVAPWAVAAGAELLEKHFTLDRSLPGPDHHASVEPDELSQLVETVRLVETTLGDGVKQIASVEAGNKPIMQKSVVARHDLPAGTVLAESDLACKRPGTGLPPKWTDRMVGATVRRAIAADQQINIDDLKWSKD